MVIVWSGEEQGAVDLAHPAADIWADDGAFYITDVHGEAAETIVEGWSEEASEEEESEEEGSEEEEETEEEESDEETEETREEEEETQEAEMQREQSEKEATFQRVSIRDQIVRRSAAIAARVAAAIEVVEQGVDMQSFVLVSGPAPESVSERALEDSAELHSSDGQDSHSSSSTSDEVVEDESAQVSGVENSKATLSESRAAAESMLQAVIVAKSAAAKSEEAPSDMESSLGKAAAEKAELAAALSGTWQILKVGEWTDSPHSHIEAIQPLLSKLSLDESMKAAQRSVLTKKPCDRDGFDCTRVLVSTVMDQLDKCFQAKIEELARFLEFGKSQSEAKAAQVAQDAAAREAAELQQKASSKDPASRGKGNQQRQWWLLRCPEGREMKFREWSRSTGATTLQKGLLMQDPEWLAASASPLPESISPLGSACHQAQGT
ncbi:unnamed protein product [Symbiodinium natans]|uniref:Uncharacterized protein n=1 Tax=Symbiodinium natans TaxID=878477 RepID=A0A812QM00_9DINO|nr:unnamed protein product [Symbiodinium natans]